MNPILGDLVSTIRLADVVDVLLLAAFLYVGIGWLRRSSSGSAARRVVALATVFALAYGLADVFDLYLMEWLLSGLLVGVLIAGVVVFQSDLRRVLDRLATWSFRGRPAAASPTSPLEILVEASARLAQERTGALIAIRGREPWDSHVQGGVELGGRVSRPLLYSIFHSDSPGHDGALLMEGDRVTRFGVHLPLATTRPEVSRYGGTRHAAALGLAQECDALVIVVSEERGAISVAHDGRLDEMGSPGELAERVGAFWDRNYSRPADGATRWSRRSAESAAMALGLAVCAWLVSSSSGDTVHRTFDAPVEFRNVPEGWAIQRDSALSALVTLAGSENAFRRLEPGTLAVSFDLANPQAGTNRLPITEDQLRLPSGLRLYDVVPRELVVNLQRRTAVELPVRVNTVGVLADSLALVAEPERVTVMASGEPGQIPDHVPTEPVDLRSLARGGSARVRLSLPAGTELRGDQTPTVTVRLTRRSAAAPS